MASIKNLKAFKFRPGSTRQRKRKPSGGNTSLGSGEDDGDVLGDRNSGAIIRPIYRRLLLSIKGPISVRIMDSGKAPVGNTNQARARFFLPKHLRHSRNGRRHVDVVKLPRPEGSLDASNGSVPVAIKNLPRRSQATEHAKMPALFEQFYGQRRKAQCTHLRHDS